MKARGGVAVCGVEARRTAGSGERGREAAGRRPRRPDPNSRCARVTPRTSRPGILSGKYPLIVSTYTLCFQNNFKSVNYRIDMLNTAARKQHR